MLRRVVLGALLGLGWAAGVFAAELSPLDKALHALALKQKAAETAAGQTPTAQAAAGPTSPAMAAPFGSASTPLAAGTTPTAGAVPLGFASTPLTAGTTLGASAPLALSGTAQPAAPVVTDPLQLTATATVDDVSLGWANTIVAKTNYTGFKVLRLKSGGEWEQVAQGPAKQNWYRDVSVTTGADFLYQVAVVDPRGQTLLASQTHALRLGKALPPEMPTGVQTSPEDERLHVSWQPAMRGSRDLRGYAIWRAPEAGGAEHLVATTPTAKAEYYDDSVDPYVSYRYRVQAVDAKGLTGPASGFVTGYARARNRNSLVLMSTAYRGLGLTNTGITADLQFAYFIGTLYGEQNPELSKLALYLDPISLWLLNADLKYTLLTDPQSPVAVAVGAKGGIQLFAGQQSSTSGSFTFSSKSSFQPLWGGYVSFSRTFGSWGLHASYLEGTTGSSLYYLSKYMQPNSTSNLVGLGVDVPLARRLNAAVEVLYPIGARQAESEHPVLINTHVDRLLNFDISYLHWDQGWALLGYFNIRFTVYPGSDR